MFFPFVFHLRILASCRHSRNCCNWYFTLCDFFSPAVGLSLDTEREQVSSGLQDSSQYSSRSSLCLDGLDSFNTFSNILGPFQAHKQQSQSSSCSIAFSVLWQGPSIYLSFQFILFALNDLPNRQNLQDAKFSIYFFLINSNSGLLVGISWFSFILNKAEKQNFHALL